MKKYVFGNNQRFSTKKATIFLPLSNIPPSSILVQRLNIIGTLNMKAEIQSTKIAIWSRIDDKQAQKYEVPEDPCDR